MNEDFEQWLSRTYTYISPQMRKELLPCWTAARAIGQAAQKKRDAEIAREFARRAMNVLGECIAKAIEGDET